MSAADASRAQRAASAPEASTWLTANAGSGKTKVLTDRVARLLLEGVPPEKILCLTYTKAAASEMQIRLFERLGKWAMKPDAELRGELEKLGVEGGVTPERLRKARRLFAAAVETPGGLKIQTIHAFCASILRRFPLEAGVAPDFQEMDDRSARLMRAEIADAMAEGPEAALFAALAETLTGDLDELLATIARHAQAFRAPPDTAALWAEMGVPVGLSPERLRASVLLGGEEALLERIAPVLVEKGGKDGEAAEVLAARPLTLPQLEKALLSGPGAKEPFVAKIGTFPTKPSQAKLAADLPALEALMRRVEAARPQRLGLEAAQRTATLRAFGQAFVARLDAAKDARRWLDFDDLITRTAELLATPGLREWVLFRLDGGIDHILVDEAQDTSPAQWSVILSLLEEFTAGEGARGAGRTVFVVGDPKQSIYSFQGADIASFFDVRGRLKLAFAPVGRLQELSLLHSFRSSQEVLGAVDQTFAQGATGLGDAPRHLAFFDKPGRVDLWPVVEPAGKAERDDWEKPVDRVSENHHTTVLARRIAEEIAAMLAQGVQIPVRDGDKITSRPCSPGDFLVLVRSRGTLFQAILRACKAAGLPIAGADRIDLGAELAVRDLLALLAWLDTPEDDLALATLLRSPLGGLSEQELFTLAARRPEAARLTEALRATQAHPGLRAMLTELRDASGFLRPYDLLERALTRHGGRDKLLRRLGPEAEDGIDELLTQALAYERSEVPSLTGFLVWMQQDEIEIKRSVEARGGLVRVMTVHGSKGLEAPIVIVPQAEAPKGNHTARILLGPDRLPHWMPAKENQPPPLAALAEAEKDREARERDRLLYVAMTRAESWLIVAAAGKVDTSGEGGSWYRSVARGLEAAGAVEAVSPGGQTIKRLELGGWPAPGAPYSARTGEPEAPLPLWATSPAPAPTPAPPPVRPTGLGGAKVLRGAEADADALLYGARLHLLLEHLPGWAPDEAEAKALALLGDGPESAGPDAVRALLAEASGLLAAPELALEGDLLREVPVTAELGGQRLLGVIDLLSVTPERVLAVDYKTNAVVPKTADEVPEGLLRQMAAYASALAQIYPERRVETAIFWTSASRLMPLPDRLLAAALP